MRILMNLSGTIAKIFVSTIAIVSFTSFTVYSAEKGAPAENKAPVMKKLFSFGEDEKWKFINCPDERAKLIPAEGAMEFKWTPAKAGDSVILLENGFPQNSLGSPDSIRLKIKKISAGDSEATFVVRDSKGECFFLKPRKIAAGEQELVWSIPGDLSGTSWGEKPATKVNNMISGALNIYELRIISKDNTPVDILLQSGQISLENKIRIEKPIYKFSGNEKWKFIHCPPERANLAVGASGTEFKWTPEKAAESIILLEDSFFLKNIGSPDSISLGLEKTSGGEAETAFVIKDSQGECFILKPKKIEGGGKMVSWSLPEDLSGTSWPQNGSAKADKRLDMPLSLYELRLTSKDGAPVSVVFNAVGISSLGNAEDSIDVDVETGDPIHVLAAGAKNVPALKLSSSAATPVDVEVECTARDYSDQKIVLKRKFQIPANGTASWPLVEIPRKLGIWWIDYTIKGSPSSAGRKGQRSFCIMDPAGPTPLQTAGGGKKVSAVEPGIGEEFLFGMMVHTPRWARDIQELEVHATALCGAKLVRTGTSWEGIQKDQQSWNWKGMDWLVDEYGKQGIELQYIFAYTPEWAAPAEKRGNRDWLVWNRATPNLEAWGKYVEEVTKRYDRKIRFFEIWNEPDLGFFRGTLEDYLSMMKIAYGNVKKVNPRLYVLTGGFATLSYHPESKPDFQKNVIAQGQDFFDIHAIHEHSPFKLFQSTIDGPLVEVRKQLKSYKPLYCNETAITSLNGEKFQAETFVKKLAFSWARGSIGYTWYDLRNDGFNPGDPEHNYGMITNDFYPKAMYPAYNNAVRILRGKKFIRQMDIGSGAWMFLFGDDKEKVLVHWVEADNAPNQNLVAQNIIKGSTTVDLMGNPEQIIPIEGKAIISVGHTPSYIVIPGNNPDPAVEGQMISVDGPVFGLLGDKFTISGTASNPVSGQPEMKLELVLPEGFSSEEKSKKIILSGKEGRKFSFSALAPKSMDISQGARQSAKINYAFADSWKGSIEVPISLAMKMDGGKMDDNLPNFTLASHGSVYNFSEKDPNMVNKGWNGPKDLSAKIWLGKNDGKLLMKVDVADDVHCQKDKGPDIWKGDSIQLAFVVPGQDGYWEIGLARLADGSPQVVAWSIPKGMKDPAAGIKLRTTPRDGGLVYEAEFPYESMGFSDKILLSGIRFNLIVNDDDGIGRKGWVQISPGIGESKNPELYPGISIQ